MTIENPQPLPNPPSNQKLSKHTVTFSILKLILISASIGGIVGVILLFWQNNHKPKIETITRDGVVSKIQTLNRLQTVAYNVDTVIQSHKDGTWQKLWQDEQKGLFVAHGRVQAGVDLNLLKPENVTITDLAMDEKDQKDSQTLNKKITITLPPAQIFETYLDNVEVYDIKTGLFGAMPTDPDIFTQAQTAGKQQVLASACKSDILKLATENAQKQVQGLFTLANVNVTVNVVAPQTCG